MITQALFHGLIQRFEIKSEVKKYTRFFFSCYFLSLHFFFFFNICELIYIFNFFSFPQILQVFENFIFFCLIFFCFCFIFIIF